MRAKKEDNHTLFSAAYQPTRFEYFAAAALQGLVSGRSEKDIRKCVKSALNLAEEMESELAP